MEFFLFAIELLEGIGISYVGNLFSNLDYLPICCSWLIRFSINSTKQKQDRYISAKTTEIAVILSPFKEERKIVY